MRKSRFTEEQIDAALREHEAGTSPKELYRRPGIATETLCNWSGKYGGMEVSDAGGRAPDWRAARGCVPLTASGGGCRTRPCQPQ